MQRSEFTTAMDALTAVFRPSSQMCGAEADAWFIEFRDIDASALTSAVQRIVRTREERGLPSLATVRTLAYAEQRRIRNGGAGLRPFPSWWLLQGSPEFWRLRELPAGVESEQRHAELPIAPTAWVSGDSDRARGWMTRIRCGDTVMLVHGCEWSKLVRHAIAKADFERGQGPDPDAEAGEWRPVQQVVKQVTEHWSDL